MKTSTGTLCAIVAGAVLAWAENRRRRAPEIPGRDAAEKNDDKAAQGRMEDDRQAGGIAHLLWTQIRTPGGTRLTTASLSSDRPGLARRSWVRVMWSLMTLCRFPSGSSAWTTCPFRFFSRR